MNEARIVELKNIARKGETMKKIVAVLCLFVIVFSSFSLMGCNFSKTPDVELRDQLIKDYYEAFDLEISADELEKHYCGTYRGNVAFYDYWSLHYCALMTVNVAGVKYTYPDSRQVLIYSDGEFYTMAGAYDKGLIGYFDIYTIFFRHYRNEWIDR